MNASVTAMADQALATIADVDRRCGANSHLVEDADLNGAILAALRGGPSVEMITHEIQFGGRAMAMGPRVFQRHARGDCGRCLRDWEGDDGEVLDVPAGASIVRVRCCPTCVAELETGFAPLNWNSRWVSHAAARSHRSASTARTGASGTP